MSIFDHGPMLSKDRLSSATLARRDFVLKARMPSAPVKRDLLQEEFLAELAEWRKLYRARMEREYVPPPPPPPPPLPEAVALVELAGSVIARVFAKSLPQALAKDGPVENYRKPGTRRVPYQKPRCKVYAAN